MGEWVWSSVSCTLSCHNLSIFLFLHLFTNTRVLGLNISHNSCSDLNCSSVYSIHVLIQTTVYFVSATNNVVSPS